MRDTNVNTRLILSRWKMYFFTPLSPKIPPCRRNNQNRRQLINVMQIADFKKILKIYEHIR